MYPSVHAERTPDDMKGWVEYVWRVSEKGVDWGVSASCFASRGARHAPPRLPDRPHRRPVGDPRAAGAAAQAGRPAADASPARDRRRDALRAARRRGLAVAAARVPAVADRLPLLPPVADERHLGADQRRPARAGPGPGRATPQPSGAILDSQSGQTTERGVRGYDGGKKVSGRKRHILVDTDGLLLKVSVHPADVADATGRSSC